MRIILSRSARCAFTLLALALLAAPIAIAQSATPLLLPVVSFSQTWDAARVAVPSKGRLFVVTVDHPDSRQSCRIQSFTAEKLVCSRALGGPRTYRPEQVAALIVPGDGGLRIPLLLGINAGAGAAVWGTVVLAAACPVCAVATGIAALLFFGAAGAVAYADDQPPRLLYLASGQPLSPKLGYVEAR